MMSEGYTAQELSTNIGGDERCKENGCTRPNDVPCRHPYLLLP